MSQITVYELLTRLRKFGIRIRADGDRLRLSAPPGTVTTELKSQISEMKPQLLEFLHGAELRYDREPERIQPARYSGKIPLSFAQQRLWMMDRLGLASMAYVTQVPVRIEGPLDPEAWRQSLAEFVRRHDILRTTIEEVDGEPLQGVSYPQLTGLPLVDLSDLSEPHRAEQVKQLISADAQLPFDLTRGPLVRRKLLRLGEREHVLLLIFHHIVADGWTLGIMAKELLTLYEAYRLGAPSPLSKPLLQYGDYVVWQRRQLQGKCLEDLMSYWKRQLSGIPPLLNLPTDHPRPLMESFRGAAKPFTLPKQLNDSLTRLARAEGVSRFMIISTALNVLLYRYTNQEDIAVGTVVANRNRSELEDLVGCFINTLVLRTDLSGNPGFRELLKKSRRVALEAYDHQDLPFDKLVEHLQPERNLSHSPLFQVMILLQNAPLPKLDRAGLSISALDIDSGNAPFDLSFSIFDVESGWSFPNEDRFDDEIWLGTTLYNTDLFESATIDRLLAHFCQLLQSIVETPHERIDSLRLLDHEEDRSTAKIAAAPTKNFVIETIHWQFERQTDRTPNAVAVVSDNCHITYQELNRRANQLARYLRTRGIGPEERVGLYVDHGLNMIVGLLGILKAGGAYVPLDPAQSSERTVKIVLETRMQLILTQGSHRDALATGTIVPMTVRLDDDWPTIARESSENLIGSVTTDNLAYVLFTSGSTGEPKGVPVSHANVVSLLRSTTSWFEFSEADVWTLFHSVAFDFSVWEIWGALLHGGRLVIVPYLLSRSPDEFLGLIHRERVTVLNQTPSAFMQLLKTDKACLGKLSMRCIIFGGERLELAELLPWCDIHGHQKPSLVNMYGITETTVHVTYRPLKQGDLHAGRSVIGEPIPDTSVHLLDQRLQPVPIGIAGEIHVGGARLSRGYLDQPDLSADRFVPCSFEGSPGARMYRSGDMARWLNDGNLEYLGRNDEQVKIRGFRIEPREVSSALCEHPVVQQAVVVSQNYPQDEQRLVAYFVTDSDQVPSVSDLSRFLSTKLPDYMVPSAYVSLEALPLTANGKTDHRALPLMEPIQASTGKTYEPPETQLEQYLAVATAEVLGVERIGVTDNFFELGGHSLTAVKLITKMRENGIQLSLRVLFKDPNVRSMAQAVQQDSLQIVKQTSIPRVSRDAYLVDLPSGKQPRQ